MPAASTSPIEQAFDRIRRELEVRSSFPAAVLAEATRVVRERVPAAVADRADRRALPFVTIDPPGSRDLDQAVQAERLGAGYRLRYAIADVGFWVARGGAIEAEAWRRGVTVYAPDERESLYPPVLSEGAASLLADVDRPAVLFDFELDERAELVAWTVERALVRSRAQLTYGDLLRANQTGAAPAQPDAEWAETLALLGEIGPKRSAREAERGGVSLPVRDQQVQRRAAAALGYQLVYEEPNAAESWNAQVSLLTGHAAARRMIEAGVGLLRTMPAFTDGDVARFRRIALSLGFTWPASWSYAAFMQRLRPDEPRADVIARQARRVMRGAAYAAFEGAPPEQPLHGALGFVYAHATAPLRRLADRYVLDLLVTLAAGGAATDEEVATLHALVPVMATTEHRANALERRVVDLAEAWTLRDRLGDVLPGVAIDVGHGEVEVQIESPPVRTGVALGDRSSPPLGAPVSVRLTAVDLEQGNVRFEFAG